MTMRACLCLIAAILAGCAAVPVTQHPQIDIATPVAWSCRAHVACGDSAFRTIAVETPFPSPEGIHWDRLSDQDLEDMSILKDLKTLGARN